jgi:preprotein translocase subunit SecY
VKINKEIRDIILKRLLVTLGYIYPSRTFLPVPGINHIDLFYIQSHSVTRSLVSTFSGDDTFVIGLFTLNIFPYINASILVQLILGFRRNLPNYRKKGDLEGRRSINRLTRFITLIWAVIQSVSGIVFKANII